MGFKGFWFWFCCIWVCSWSFRLHRKVEKLKGKCNVCVVVGFLRREFIVSTELDWLKLGQMVDPFGFIEMLKYAKFNCFMFLFFWDAYCLGPFFTPIIFLCA